MNALGVNTHNFGIRPFLPVRTPDFRPPVAETPSPGPQEVFQFSGSSAPMETTAPVEPTRKEPELAEIKAKIENLQGMDSVKAQLLAISQTMSSQQRRGQSAFNGISPYLAVDGPPGPQRTQGPGETGEQ